MKNAALFGFMILLLAGGTYAAFHGLSKQEKTAITPLKTEFRYNRLNDGTVVIQEVPATPLEEVEPAAGEGTSNTTFPKYKYDPLTQTFRAE